MEKQTVYLAALFHDIGKLIERSKVYDNKEVNKKYSNIRYSHARYTAFFLKNYIKQIDWIEVSEKDEIYLLASYHHNPNSFKGKILQLADWLASSERVEDIENTSQYNTVQMQSIFGALNDRDFKKYYTLSDLNFKNFIPSEKDGEQTRISYHQLSEQMLNDFKRVNDKEDLYFILEKYFTFVPAQTTKNVPDISLFDHSKLTSAIAICLDKEVESNKIDEKSLNRILKTINKKELTEEYFILINADLSGIQNYIFNTVSKGAGKSLKGRSSYIILLMEAICEYMIDKLDLEKSNIIYNGGGNSYILAPASMTKKVEEIRKEINNILFDNHHGKLFCNIGYTKIKLFEFRNFSDVWKRVSMQTNKIKQKKLSDIWEEKYDKLFEPNKLIENDNYCRSCYSTKYVSDYGGNKLCSLCQSFAELTKEISKANYIQIEKKRIKNNNEKITYKSVLNEFGYDVRFSNRVSAPSESYVINEFGNKNTLKWKLGAYNLPLEKNNSIKTFEELSGTKDKLAFLKLDVDNLGNLFSQGLSNPSLSRMSVLSRMMKIFFEGVLPNRIKELGLENKIYVVFSGGDDTFLIGSIGVILNFAKDLQELFSDFVCNNPTITFSAGIGIFHYNFPIIKATQITEQYLEDAKELVYPEDREKEKEEPKKDKVAILGEVFSWLEFGYLLKIKNVIVDIIENDKSKSRGIIQKVINSTKGFQPLMKSAEKSRLSSQKIWRLRYFLRNIDNKDRIIKIYEDMWFENFFELKENKIKNHQIITVAAKLADLQTRKEK